MTNVDPALFVNLWKGYDDLKSTTSKAVSNLKETILEAILANSPNYAVSRCILSEFCHPPSNQEININYFMRTLPQYGLKINEEDLTKSLDYLKAVGILEGNPMTGVEGENYKRIH